MILGRNDLVQDAPISRIDLLSCRNVLMYLNAETQSRVLRRFAFALAPDGFLFLGNAELLLGHSSLFRSLDSRRRVFVKLPGAEAATPTRLDARSLRRPFGGDTLIEEVLLAYPLPVIVVDKDGTLVHVSRQAEVLFGVSARDLGRPFRDLELSYRPRELRPAIEQAELDRRTVRIRDVELMRGTEVLHLEIRVTPLVDRTGSPLGTTIAFQDVSEAFRLRAELETANRQLETAYEELQSSNEELETTNEELQSTVEELETTNEELQSTNDELQTINDSLRERTEEVDRLNAFLNSVLTGLRAGVVVVDRDLRIQVWNQPAQDMWGLRADETIGQHLLALDVGLDLGQLRPQLRAVVAEDGDAFEATLPGVNRLGRDVRVRVVGTALRDGDGRGDVHGAILLMEASHDTHR